MSPFALLPSYSSFFTSIPSSVRHPLTCPIPLGGRKTRRLENWLTCSGSVSDFFFTRPEPGNNSPIGEGSGSGSGSVSGLGRNRRTSAERDGGR